MTVMEKRHTLPAQADRVALVKVSVRRGIGLVEPLLKVVGDKGWIAGGYARWCCSPVADPAVPNDVDVFFAEHLDVLNVSDELVKLGAKVVKDVSYFVQLDVSGAFPGFGIPAVQLVKPQVSADGHRVWGPTKDDVIRQIDLTVCRVALDGPGSATATADPYFEADETEKRIRFRRIKNPASEMRHAFKYAARGYKLTQDDALTLLEDWAQRDPADRSALVQNFENYRGGY